MTIRTMPRQIARIFVAAIAGGILAPASAQTLKTGEQVYQETCLACHASGAAGAPKGGNPTLSLEEFARATAYMAAAAGGSWRDPDSAMLKRIRREETKRLATLK